MPMTVTPLSRARSAMSTTTALRPEVEAISSTSPETAGDMSSSVAPSPGTRSICEVAGRGCTEKSMPCG